MNVSWAHDPQSGAVDLAWTERGGPQVVAPTRSGLGLASIEAQLSYELDDSSELAFAPAGLLVKLHIPRWKTEEPNI